MNDSFPWERAPEHGVTRHRISTDLRGSSLIIINEHPNEHKHSQCAHTGSTGARWRHGDLAAGSRQLSLRVGGRVSNVTEQNPTIITRVRPGGRAW